MTYVPLSILIPVRVADALTLVVDRDAGVRSGFQNRSLAYSLGVCFPSNRRPDR